MISRRLKLCVAIGTVALIATPALAGMVQDRDPTVVYRWDGKIAGKDPDANVRFQLLRDSFANEN
jgi:hypothetical protein